MNRQSRCLVQSVGGAALLTLLTSCGDPQSSLGVSCNLIVNGGAEAASGSSNHDPVATPGWTSSGRATAGQYGVSGWPAPDVPGPPRRGLNFFSGGPADAQSSLTQTVDVRPYASAIDGAGVKYTLSGWLGGWEDQGDTATLSVAFQDTSSTGAIDSAQIGPVTASERASDTGLQERSSTGLVPAGTRGLLVTITMVRQDGSNNDGYADELSLVFDGVPVAPAQSPCDHTTR